MKGAILGVNGYIGQHLAHYLLQKGWDVKGYDIAPAAVLPELSYESLDVSKREQFEKLDTAVDYIFYFSGITGTARAFDEFETYIEVNEKGLLHLLNLLRKNGKSPRIVFPSTRLVYKGVSGQALTEEAEKEFKTIYALNKWFGENILKQYSVYFGIPFTIFRICVPYGSFLGKGYSYGTVGFFLNKSINGQDISLYGTGEQRRTFTHVEDICQQVVGAIILKESENQIFNIGGEAYSLKEVADAIAKKYRVSVNLVPWPSIDEQLESGDTIFDATRIEQLLKTPYLNNFHNWLESIEL